MRLPDPEVIDITLNEVLGIPGDDAAELRVRNEVMTAPRELFPQRISQLRRGHVAHPGELLEPVFARLAMTVVYPR